MAQYRRTASRIIGAVASAAVAVSATGCGSSQNGTGQKPSQDCVAPGVTEDDVELGLLYPDTGAFESAFTLVRAGIDARLSAANSAGGVHGRSITYTWQDDASNSSSNLAGALALVESNDVFGIMEMTPFAAGSADVLHERGIPVTGVALESVWNTRDNMFTFVNFLGQGSVSTWGDYTLAQGGSSALILRGAFDDGPDSVTSRMVASLRAVAIEVVGDLEVTPGAISSASLGAQIRASGADTLIGLISPDAFIQGVVAARAAGVDLKVAMSYSPGYDQRLLQQFGPQLAGVSYYLDYSPFEIDAPGHREFRAAMIEFAPQVQPPTNGGALSGWIVADMMLRGLEEAGECPTRQRFIEALRSVTDYDANGLLPAPLDLTRSLGQMTNCFTFVKVSADGARFEVVQPAPLCGSQL